METVNVKLDEEFRDRQFYRESPLKTGKIAFSLYDFEPWQALQMQRSPDSDTILYFVDGEAYMLINDAVYSVGPGDAMYVPAGMTYGVLAGGNDLNVAAIKSPKPQQVQQENGLFFRCPDCDLEAPLTTGTENGDINMCPRCETMVKLTKEASGFKAEKTQESPPEETGPVAETGQQAPAGRGEPSARMEFGVLDFQPWQALPMRRHPDSDTLLYVAQGIGILFVEDELQTVGANEAVYVPANSAYGILSADNQLTIMSVQGPVPVKTEEIRGLEYSCPICRLQTPVTSNTSEGCITVCPRCNVKLKLTKAEELFKAEETTEPAPTEAEAQ